MKARQWITLSGITLGAVGVGLALKSFLPQRFPNISWPEIEARTPLRNISALPKVEISILRCGSVTIREPIAVRGAFTLAPRVISHSAVLIRHPKATFLYDTGLSADITMYLVNQSFFFRKVLARFSFEQSLYSHLQHLHETPDFVLLSHLHWDHVSGIPDIPDVPLYINRVEYDAAKLSLLDANHALVRRLLGNNPMNFFECDGPSYLGFRSSHDLFGDGSVMLVPLPGHTAGNTGMFIHRSNGPTVFLIGDAAWVSPNYLRPTPMHPFIWNAVTGDDATARQTLSQLHAFALAHPEISMIAMHDGATQEHFMSREPTNSGRIPILRATS